MALVNLGHGIMNRPPVATGFRPGYLTGSCTPAHVLCPSSPCYCSHPRSSSWTLNQTVQSVQGSRTRGAVPTCYLILLCSLLEPISNFYLLKGPGCPLSSSLLHSMRCFVELIILFLSWISNVRAFCRSRCRLADNDVSAEIRLIEVKYLYTSALNYLTPFYFIVSSLTTWLFYVASKPINGHKLSFVPLC